MRRKEEAKEMGQRETAHIYTSRERRVGGRALPGSRKGRPFYQDRSHYLEIIYNGNSYLNHNIICSVIKDIS